MTTTFGADFSLDGGASWDEIPTTVDVPGPSTTVTVKEAKAVLGHPVRLTPLTSLRPLQD